MLVALQITPVVLSLLILGAHFLRSGNLTLVAAIGLLVVLLPLRRRWLARAVQLTLAVGALEWLRTLIQLATARGQVGQPAGRLVLILGLVAGMTGLSALAFQTKTLGRVFGIRRSDTK